MFFYGGFLVLKIALCDDDAKNRDVTHNLLEKYAKDRGLVFKIHCYSTGDELLHGVMEHGCYDLYILDIIMPKLNGIDAGLKLRRLDANGIILYLTSSRDFALESYEVHAYYYLLKPLVPDKLFSLMNEIVSLLEKKHSETIRIKTADGSILVTFDQILYAELSGRAVCYELADKNSIKSMTFSGSFKDVVEPLLADNRFFLCGASFLVNLYYIKMVDKAGALFTTGKYLELPKSACAKLRLAWSDYWLNNP